MSSRGRAHLRWRRITRRMKGPGKGRAVTAQASTALTALSEKGNGASRTKARGITPHFVYKEREQFCPVCRCGWADYTASVGGGRVVFACGSELCQAEVLRRGTAGV